MNKKRNSTIEMLRIISMLGVVGLHYFNKKLGGALNTTVPVNIYIAHFLESLCITSVNIFVLIVEISKDLKGKFIVPFLSSWK